MLIELQSRLLCFQERDLIQFALLSYKLDLRSGFPCRRAAGLARLW
jgi:hypothetical protein